MNTMSRDILLDLIDADPDQPRKQFDADKIAELAQSIAANGLAVPILLRPVNGRYLIVHGERRFRAVQTLGWSSILAEVREIDAETARWLSLVENVQRADLSPIEEANAYQAMIQTGVTQTALGKRIGKTQSYIAQKLRLLKMAPEVQAALDDGTLSEGQARQLLRLPLDRIDWPSLVNRIVGEDWPVRRLRNFVDKDLLVWQPLWWPVEGRYPDLASYVERMENEVRYKYAERKWLQSAQDAKKKHEVFVVAFAQAGYESLAEYMITEMRLHNLNACGKQLSFYREYKTELCVAVKAVITRLFDVESLIWPEGMMSFIETIPPPDGDGDDDDDEAWGAWKVTFIHAEAGRRAAWFDQVVGLRLSYEEMMQTAYVPMSRDIEVVLPCT